jgi:hypothetical protein
MDNEVVRGVDGAQRFVHGQYWIDSRPTHRQKGWPLDTHREQRMRHNAFGTARI